MNLNEKETESGDSNDIRRLLFKVLSFWPIILTSVFVATMIAFYVSRSTQNLYEVASTLIVEDQSSDNLLGGAENVISLTWSDSNPLAGRKALLKSFKLNFELAKKLGWEVSYWSRGRIKENEVYNQSPFKVHFDNIKPQYLGVNYNLVLRSSNFTIVPEKVKSIKKYNFSSLESEGISDSEFSQLKGIILMANGSISMVVDLKLRSTRKLMNHKTTIISTFIPTKSWLKKTNTA